MSFVAYLFVYLRAHPVSIRCRRGEGSQRSRNARPVTAYPEILDGCAKLYEGDASSNLLVVKGHASDNDVRVATRHRSLFAQFNINFHVGRRLPRSWQLKHGVPCNASGHWPRI